MEPEGRDSLGREVKWESQTCRVHGWRPQGAYLKLILKTVYIDFMTFSILFTIIQNCVYISAITKRK